MQQKLVSFGVPKSDATVTASLGDNAPLKQGTLPFNSEGGSISIADLLVLSG